MFKIGHAFAASATLVLTATSPVWAGETTTQSSMMIASIGRDVDAISGGKHTNAKIVSASPADMPVIENQLALSGRTQILVHLDANGSLTGATVNSSSGRPRFDQSALRAVRGSTYAAERVDGHAVGGSYLVDVTFSPEPVSIARAAFALAAVLSTAAPAAAADTVTLRGALVADLGRDQTGLRSDWAEARLVSAVSPERAYFDLVTNAAGRVAIGISLDAAGKVVGARVLATSGRPTLDASALAAVRASTYAAATVAGHPVGGSYAVDVEFDSADGP